MFKSGLVSISFRKLNPENIIEMVRTAGLDAIEWGGDIHVPHGNIETALAVKKLCNEAGIECPSYGSYYRVGEYEDPREEFAKVIACSDILSSSIIRVWAGVIPSESSDETHFVKIVNELKILCEMAGESDTGIALEFHANTLTDTAESTRKLLDSVGKPNLSTYWQPPVGRSMEQNKSEINMLLENISNIHTFSWNGRERLELKSGYQHWVNYMKELDTGRDRYCLLEFIKDDSIEGFYRDAITLRTLVELF